MDIIAANIGQIDRDKEIYRLKEENAALRAKPKNTWCAYCGYEVDIDDDAATKISEHIQSCPSHPMRVWERHSEALEEQNKALSRKLATLNALVESDEAADNVADKHGHPDNELCDECMHRESAIDDYRKMLREEMK